MNIRKVNMQSLQKLRYVKGLSLVELMVAVLLGVMLLAGVIQIMINKKDAYNFQQGQSLVQENSRFSMHFMEDILERTGFRQLPERSREVAFPYRYAANGCAAFKEGQVLAPLSSGGAGMCLRYQPINTGSVDCQGNAIDAATTEVVEQITFDASSNELRCAAQGATAQALVGEIENMTVSFGLDSDDDRVVDKFISSPTANQWSEIMSIRFDALFASNVGVGTSQTYRFPITSSTETTAADSRLYRAISRTVTLKNISL